MLERWVESLAWLVDAGGAETSWQMITLRIALIGCSFLLMVQVLSLLATRWGDQNATGKSFFASLVLHVWLGLAWANVAQLEAVQMGQLGREELETYGPAIQLVSSEQNVPETEAGYASLSRLSPAESLAIERTEREITASEIAETGPIPDLTPREKPAQMASLDTLPQLPFDEPKPVTPRPGMEVQQPIFSGTPAATAPLPQETIQQQVVPNSLATMSRQKMTPQETPLDSDDRRPPSEGGADRADEKVSNQATRIELPVELETENPLPNAPAAETMTRRTAPLATPLPANQAGADGTGIDPQVRPSVPAKPQFSRQIPNRSVIPTEGLPLAITPAEPSTGTLSAPPAIAGEQIAAIKSATELPRMDALAPALEVNRTPGSILPKRPAASMAPETYLLRRLDQRQEIAVRNGGTLASEAAVELSLKWLAAHQESDGSWSPSRWGAGSVKRSPEDPVDLVDRKGSGLNADTGITGLALLSFLGAGYTRDEGQYSRTVTDAMAWLISQQRVDGYLGGKANYYDGMYCHGIAGYALAEACAMQEDSQADPELRNAVARAVQFTIQMQNRDGGWRYQKGAIESDMSMFGWQMMLLKSAEIAGIPIPQETRDGMITFLKARSRGAQSGLAGYRRSSQASPAMTAEAHFCKQMFGIRPTNEASIEATNFLQRALPRISQPNDYYWYYGTLTMFQHGGEPWEAWNLNMRESLVQTQKQSGEFAGTWDPKDPWGGIGGRVYSTAMATLCLEVYYRFLPLYRVNEPSTK